MTAKGNDIERAAGVEGESGRTRWFSLRRDSSVTDWLLVAVAVLQICVAALQLRVISQANQLTAQVADRSDKANAESRRLTSESNERAQRAWVLAHEMEGMDLKAAGTGDTRMVLKNSGKSPAQKVVIQATWVLGELPAQIGVRNSGPSVSRSLIGPGKEYWTPVSVLGVAPADVPGVVSGATPLYLAGNILYEDVFSKDRVTVFCWHYLPTRKHFEFCSALNEAR
jgi:hypothetical protein